jgi:5-methylcytosine-specific restriction endonuclease McrA
MPVLVLNATYEPLNVVPVRRAIVLLLKEKAELVEAAEATMRAERVVIPVPLVIRLLFCVPVPHRLVPPLSRRTVLARDRYTCQYCGAQPGKGRLTIDHVVPRARGGETAWENIVAACDVCNRRKGNRTPEEAGLRLRARPARPRYLAVVLMAEARGVEAWGKYLR